MRKRTPHPIATVLELFKKLRDCGVIDRSTLTVAHQIALAHVSDIARFLVLSEKVIKRLIARWTHVLRDCFVPFFAVCKDRIDIEDYSAKVEQAVAYDLANAKAAAGLPRGVYGASRLAREEVRPFHGAKNMALRTRKTSVLAEGASDMPAFCCTLRLGKEHSVG